MTTPLVAVELMEEVFVDERVHGDEWVRVRVRSLRIAGGGPSLAVEQTTLPGGPTRAVVILVHGFAQNRLTWRVSQRSFAGFLAKQGYDVWNLDLRGHGNSRSYESANATSIQDYVEDLVRVVQCCPTPPFVIGHSLGGGVAVGASTEVQLAGLIHMAGIFGFATQNPTLRALAKASLLSAPALRRVRLSTRWAGRWVGRLFDVADASSHLLPVSGWAAGSVEPELVAERLEHGFDWTSVDIWLDLCRWASGEPFDYAAAFTQVDVPLLVLAGNADSMLHPDDARQCYSASGSRDRQFIEFEPFEHEVHWGHLDIILGTLAPRHVWPVIADWLEARHTFQPPPHEA